MMNHEYFTDQTFKYAKRVVVNDSVCLVCPDCQGSGEFCTSHRNTCTSCRGWGHIPIEDFEAKVEQANKHRADQEFRNQIIQRVKGLTSEQMRAVEEFLDKSLLAGPAA
jgi:DnaJ-class molecular chaperone